MSKLYAGAMMTIMALCVFGVVVPLGAVAPDVAVVPYLLIGLLTILLAGGLVFCKEFTWTPSPMHWPVALFALYAFARYAASPYLKSPFYEYDGRLELFQIGASVLVYFCCATYFHRLSHRNLFLVVLLLLALFQAGYGIWQVATKAETVLVWDRPEVYKGRASGTFIYPNHMAGFLEMALGWA